MKCKGELKVKAGLGKTRKMRCTQTLDEHAIFCPVCGTETAALKTGLNGTKAFKAVWAQRTEIFRAWFPFSLVFGLIIGALIGASLVLGHQHYWLNNLFLLFVVPFALVPLTFSQDASSRPGFAAFFAGLRYYPVLWAFTLVNIVFFFIVKVLCTGFLLNVEIDQTLHLVRLILCIYWPVVMLPVVHLVVERKMPLFTAIKVSYKAGKETRWQQFYVLFYSLLLNAVGAALAGVGLAFTLPISYRAIQLYASRMDEYTLFEIERG
jgi:hypothetical protein